MFCELPLAVTATCRDCTARLQLGSACKNMIGHRLAAAAAAATASRFEGSSMIGRWLGTLYWNAKYNEQIALNATS